jgi:predicted dehydrogenase
MTISTSSHPRIAITGCGRMGHDHAQACLRAGAHIVALHDAHRESAGELARTIGGGVADGQKPPRIVASLEALPWSTLDALFICTPPAARGSAELLAIDADLPFFVEKPIACNAAAVRKVREALLGHPRPPVTAVGYMNRYRPSVQRARIALQSAPLLGISAHWAGKPYRKPWWADPAGSGGPVNEQCTHLVDLARYLAGEVTTAEALANPGGSSAAIALRHTSGVLSTIFYSCDATTKAIGLRAFTPTHVVELADWDFRLLQDGSSTPPPPPDADKSTAFQREVDAFLAVVAGRAPADTILSDYADAFRTQCVMDAIRRSWSSGHAENPDFSGLSAPPASGAEA